MIKENSLDVKDPGESKVEGPGEGGGVAEYATERHSKECIKLFIKNSKFMFRHVLSRTLGNYAPEN